MSTNTAKSLTAHLCASWSTVEKKDKPNVCSLSLASQILAELDKRFAEETSTAVEDVRSANSHIAARLISLLLSRGSSDAIIQTIDPYLQNQPVSTPAWPIAVTHASVAMNIIEEKLPTLVDPFHDTVNRLSSLVISPDIFREDPCFATPLELVAVGLRILDRNSVNDQGTSGNGADGADDDDDDDVTSSLRLMPIYEEVHYTPNLELLDRFDYYVKLGLKDPPPRPTNPAARLVSSSPRFRTGSTSTGTSPLATLPQLPSPANPSSLIPLGRYGPNAGPPELARMRLTSSKAAGQQNGHSNPSASISPLQPNTNTNQRLSALRRRSFPANVIDLCSTSSKERSLTTAGVTTMAGTRADATAASHQPLSPNQASTDYEVQIVDLTDAGTSSHLLPCIMNDDIEAINSSSVQQDNFDSEGDMGVPARPEKPQKQFNERDFRLKLHQKKRDELKKRIAMNETRLPDLPSTLPDTVYYQQEKRSKRAIEILEKRKLTLEKEAAKKKRQFDMKKRRLSDQEESKQRFRKRGKNSIDGDDVDDDDDGDDNDNDDDNGNDNRRPEKVQDEVVLLDGDYSILEGPQTGRRMEGQYGTRDERENGREGRRTRSMTESHWENGRTTRSMTESHSPSRPTSRRSRGQSGSSDLQQILSERRKRLMNSIHGHDSELRPEDLEKIDRFLEGSNDMFIGTHGEPLGTLDILLHTNCDGLAHSIRLHQNPRKWEEVREDWM